MIKKLALVVAGPMMVPDQDPELRYTVWEKPSGNPDGSSISQVVLRYQDQSIGDILVGAQFSFRTYGYSVASKTVTAYTAEPGRFTLHLHASIQEEAHMEIIPLGMFEDTLCYLIKSLPVSPTRTWFGITQLPLFWKSSVIYNSQTVREAYTSRNVTGVKLTGPAAPAYELDLFDFIDRKVQAQFTEIPNLLHLHQH